MTKNKTLQLDIVTQEKRLLQQEVLSVTLQTVNGELTILPEHTPLLTQLKEGILTYQDLQQQKQYVAIFGGFAEVSDQNQVSILADAAVRGEDIDIAEVEKAKQEADKIIEKLDVHEHDLLMAEVTSRQSLIKLKAAKLYQSQN